MSPLQRQTLTVIETCQRMLQISKRLRPEVDMATINVVTEILAKVLQERPGNKAFANVTVDAATLTWWTLLNTMQAVNRLLS